MFARYLKAQLMVLLCGGLVGPIFLVVYFALGQMSRPYLNWMFWAGLLVTAADVLVALALTNRWRPATPGSGPRFDGSGSSTPAPIRLHANRSSQRLQQLDTLYATGAITDAGYSAKRAETLADL